MRTIAFLAALAAPSFCSAAMGYSSYAHSKGAVRMEYPSDWTQTFGIEAIALQPPGRDAELAEVTLASYPLGKSPATADLFAASLLQMEGVKRVESRGKIRVAGVEGERIALVEAQPIRGDYGETLPGPLRQIYVIVPHRSRYLVLKIEGVGQPFDRALPEFERMARTLHLNAPAR